MAGTNPHKGWHSRGYQPHCDYPGLVQSIGFRLFDSVPAAVIARWNRELELLDDENRRELICERIDRYADMGYGCCLLNDRRIAKLTEDALLYFDNDRYDLLAWCVMGNHVHVLAVPQIGYSMSDILHSWKSFSAHRANKILQREGRFWFPDYFDKFMKSTQQLEATIKYIELNPVTARLVRQPADWEFSSAAPRHQIRVFQNRLKYYEIDSSNLPDF